MDKESKPLGKQRSVFEKKDGCKEWKRNQPLENWEPQPSRAPRLKALGLPTPPAAGVPRALAPPLVVLAMGADPEPVVGAHKPQGEMHIFMAVSTLGMKQLNPAPRHQTGNKGNCLHLGKLEHARKYRQGDRTLPESRSPLVKANMLCLPLE